MMSAKKTVKCKIYQNYYLLHGKKKKQNKIKIVTTTLLHKKDKKMNKK